MRVDPDQAGGGVNLWPVPAQYSSHLFSSMLQDQRLSFARGNAAHSRRS